MPDEKSKWKETLRERRQFYYQLIEEFISPPNSPTTATATKSFNNLILVLSELDVSLLEQISKDVKRTLPDISFLHQPVQKRNALNSKRFRDA